MTRLMPAARAAWRPGALRSVPGRRVRHLDTSNDLNNIMKFGASNAQPGT